MSVPDLLVDPDEHTVNGKYLTRQQWRLFEGLWRGRGRIQSIEHVHAYIWPNPDDEPEEPARLVRVVISKIREVLDGSGWYVLNVHSIGYKFTTEPVKRRRRPRKAEFSQGLGI